MFDSFTHSDAPTVKDIRELLLSSAISRDGDADMTGALLTAYWSVASNKERDGALDFATAEKLYSRVYCEVTKAEGLEADPDWTGGWPSQLPEDTSLPFPMWLVTRAARAHASRDAADTRGWYAYNAKLEKAG